MIHAVMQDLVALQEIEFGPKPNAPSNKEAAAALRAKIPSTVLGHYDRLVAKGRKGCSGVTVKGKVCLECHVSIPIGTIITIMKAADLQLCGNCGRYLYFVEEKPAEAGAGESPAGAAPKRGRKKKAAPATSSTPPENVA